MGPLVTALLLAVGPEPPADAGQAARLFGFVMSKGTRDPVAVASLFVDDAGTPAAETDGEGRFELWLTPGVHAVRVRGAAHRPGDFEERLGPRESLQVTYRIVRDVLEPYQTVVRDRADRAEQARVQLQGPELREVAGTQGEPLRVVTLLPGVTTPLTGVAYPIVRGASPAATGFYLDDVQVPQLYHLLLGPSVVYPELIDRVDFYSSNAPVRFGRVTAGVVSAAAAKSRDDRVHLAGYLDILNAGAFIEVPIARTGTNLAAAGRFSYSGLVLRWVGRALAQGATPVADFYDYQVRLEQRAGPATLRLLVFGSSDLVGSRADDPEDRTAYITSRFHRADLRALLPLGPGALEAGLTAGVETQGLLSERRGMTEGSFLLDRAVVAGRLRYRAQYGPLQVKVGADLERQQASVELEAGSSASPFEVPRTLGVFGGAFAEAALTEGRLTAVAGVRADSYLLAPGLYRFSVDPRLQLEVELHERLTAHVGAGLFHQAPLLLINLPVTDAAALADGLHTVAQLSVGVRLALPRGLELHLDGYFNDFLAARERSLAQLATGVTTLDDRLAASRVGRAYGLELLLRSPAKGRFFGWLSYSLMRSERLRQFAVYTDDQQLAAQRQATLPFAFDQTHVLNLVAGVQLPFGFKVSATFHVNSGRPETGEFTSRTQHQVPTSQGLYRWAPVPLDQVDRLPGFWRVDARVSKTFLLDAVSLELYLDVLNASAQREVVSYDYRYLALPGFERLGRIVAVKNPEGVPIVYPALGLKGSW